MWLFTNTGFVSAVKQGDDLVVRARDLESLGPISESLKLEVIKTPDADYPYRVITTPEDFARWTHHMSLNIDYPNFKSEVAQVRGHEFAHALTRVWSDMHEIEDEMSRENS